MMMHLIYEAFFKTYNIKPFYTITGFVFFILIAILMAKLVLSCKLQ